jgi:hypothetical protein
MGLSEFSHSTTLLMNGKIEMPVHQLQDINKKWQIQSN